MAGQWTSGSETTGPWFWELVEAGDTRAIVCVGDAAYDDRDYEKAEQWYQRAADNGDPEAMVRLAQVSRDTLRGDAKQAQELTEQCGRWSRRGGCRT
ncbi:SEL1-like repeat protein [Micromonospora aurantiaca (nom. illeg.)]|uniref:hypothetical protein n=1 Tax=Micromonospora aurantiaca (nom. illeg.) TaxID=47850 RepID=UPI0037BC5FF3